MKFTSTSSSLCNLGHNGSYGKWLCRISQFLRIIIDLIHIRGEEQIVLGTSHEVDAMTGLPFN